MLEASLRPAEATRRSCVERAMFGKLVGRTACFPLVDLVYASMHRGICMGSVQANPELHAQALARCARELPIDGLYVNLCLGTEQAAGASCRDGRHRVRLDDCLDVEFTDHDVAAIAHTEVRRLDDPRIESAQLFHPGMLETFLAMPADVLHICGNITPSLPAIARSCVDAVDVDAPTDWPSAVATLGPRMCLKGNLSPLLFLPENLPRLADECAASVAAAASAKGFILSTGCLVPRDSAVEAFSIVARACGADRTSCENTTTTR